MNRTWIDAIRGRERVPADQVSDLNIEPGYIDALVGQPRPFAVTVTVAPLDDLSRQRFLEAVAILDTLAALYEGELPADTLLPKATEVHTSCSCGSECCPHIVAVCYLAAEEFAADPFVLLLLRGMSKDDILGHRRREEHPPADPSWSEGVPAARAFRGEIAPPPPPLPLPPQPAPPTHLPVEVAESAALAAQRAWKLLTEQRP